MIQTDESPLVLMFFEAAGVFMGIFIGLALARYLDSIGAW